MENSTKSSPSRQELMAQVTQQLERLDDQTLQALARMAGQGTLNVDNVDVTGGPVSRRRFITAAMAGGFVAATAGAMAVWQYGSGRGHELSEDLDRVWGLVSLYEKLDDTGLDRVVMAGLGTAGAAFEGLATGIDTVKAGVKAIREVLARLDLALPAVQSNVAWLEGLVSDFMQRVHLLEDGIGRALDEVNPMAQALSALSTRLLAALPASLGTKVQEALDRMNDLVSQIPQTMADIKVKIVLPLRDDWFSDQAGKGLKGGLFEPIASQVLQPVEDLLGRQSEAVRRWEQDVVVPVKAALENRDRVRREIAEYRARYSLQPPSDARPY